MAFRGGGRHSDGSGGTSAEVNESACALNEIDGHL
jgi:hypothetical protein